MLLPSRFCSSSDASESPEAFAAANNNKRAGIILKPRRTLHDWLLQEMPAVVRVVSVIMLLPVKGVLLFSSVLMFMVVRRLLMMMNDEKTCF